LKTGVSTSTIPNLARCHKGRTDLQREGREYLLKKRHKETAEIRHTEEGSIWPGFRQKGVKTCYSSRGEGANGFLYEGKRGT